MIRLWYPVFFCQFIRLVLIEIVLLKLIIHFVIPPNKQKAL
jgi:hypothetical protein